MPFANQLRNEGATDREISGAIYQYLQIELKRFYKKPGFEQINLLKQIKNLDSKAEAIVYLMLTKYGFEFKAQYEIGPYRADFLINDFLILEIDGPHHNLDENKKRDKIRDSYLKKMGYEVLRIPIVYFSLDEIAVIESIKEAVEMN